MSHILLTTFERDGTPATTAVPGTLDRDRAYFEVRSQSDIARRLRHTSAVQVTPSRLWGFFTYGPPLDATARPLPRAEASAQDSAAADDRPAYLSRRRFLAALRHTTRGRATVRYELLPGDSALDDDLRQAGFGLPRQPGAVDAGHSTACPPIHLTRTHGTAHGAASIDCIWSSPARS